MWLLEGQAAPYAGGVHLRLRADRRSAEITYLLDPDCWGRGLAVSMAWTVIARAFRSSRISAVVAGTDQPNTASLAVMRRLGMRFHRDVQYPLGPGVEYMLRRDDAGPQPPPADIPMARIA